MNKHARLKTYTLTLAVAGVFLLSGFAGPALSDSSGAERVYTPYEEQKAVFEFYFDHPEKISGGLYWLLGMFHGSELMADDPRYQARAAALGLPDPREMGCRP